MDSAQTSQAIAKATGCSSQPGGKALLLKTTRTCNRTRRQAGAQLKASPLLTSTHSAEGTLRATGEEGESLTPPSYKIYNLPKQPTSKIHGCGVTVAQILGE